MAAKLLPPSADYWLGTDHLGRDVLSRVIYGARVSMTNGILIVLFALLIGLPIGLAAGYFGGWIDEALMRGTDVFLAFPALLLAVLMAAALGPGFLNSIIAVAVTWWPWYARLARAEVLVLRGQPYVEAARLAGVSHPRIIIRHILPATGRPLTVQAALDVGPALLTAAALSFLGLGILPPTADWGQMVDAGRKFFPARWWYSAMPGLTIFIVALAFSILGDALRDRKGGANRASA
ncbi:ABC transporter permease [Mesorhizobium sp. 1M-11]|uniref:ABC transporter permease n=1 Tax=Mesorhizobium sp. 1M-11 TaxID=1529006 RepID=UPI00191033A2|nr:ABC transporter permease [Mesorhizobium sp. 1M-11]